MLLTCVAMANDDVGVAPRALEPRDQAVLWECLHVALWDPPPAGLRPREVLQRPEVRIYAEAWGAPGDVGVIAERHGAPVGAAWMRLLRDGAGLAYVDDATPQLGIAVLPPFQRQGHGRRLLLAAIDAGTRAGYRRIALTVHPANPAIALYRACGFELAGERRGYLHMIRDARRHYNPPHG